VTGSGISWVCVSASLHLAPDNHASTPLLSFLQARMPFLPPNQQRQSTEGNYPDKHRLSLIDLRDGIML